MCIRDSSCSGGRHGQKPFAVHFAGRQHHHNRLWVRVLDHPFHLHHLPVVTRAHHHLLVFTAVPASGGQDGGPPPAAPVDIAHDLCRAFGHNERHFARPCAVHDPVHHRGGQKTEHDAIDQTVHIAQPEAAQQEDGHVKCKVELPHRQMRPVVADGHRDQIQPAGRGIVQVDQSKSNAGQRAGTQRRQQSVAAVRRQQRRHNVHKYRKDEHATQRAQQKPPAQHLITQQCDGKVEQERRHADGQPRQPVDDQRNAGKPGERKLGIHRKVVDADRHEQTADDFRQHGVDRVSIAPLFHSDRPRFPSVIVCRRVHGCPFTGRALRTRLPFSACPGGGSGHTAQKRDRPVAVSPRFAIRTA